MDKFSIGAIVIALIIEGFIVYGWFVNPNERTGTAAEHAVRHIVVASALPLVLIATVFIVNYLQRGQS